MASATAPVIVTAADQQAAQSALVSLLARPLAAAWESLNPSEPSTLDAFILAIRALVHRFGLVSGAQSARYYEASRRAAGVGGSFTVRPAAPAPAAKVESSVRWATKGLWTPEPNVESAKELVTGVAEKAVLDTGRTTIINAVQSDRKAKAWARVVEPGACSFCLLLATRGAVYRSETTASFRSHDHCKCHVEPVFSEYEPSAEVRRAQQIYRESTKGVRGPKAMRLAFRQAIDAERSNQSPPGAENAT